VTDQNLPDGGIITFSLDITNRKAAEEALRSMNAQLELRVAERTAELKAAYQELESFSYSVSHDLRAPLRAISGFASILRDEESPRLTAEGLRYLAVIDASAQQMGRLVDALLALVRTSRQVIAGSRLDMNAIAGDVIKQLSAEYPGARVELRTLPAATGDATLVRQVFVNLIGNALKYSSRNASPRVEVGVELGGEGTVYFVRDNGVGFDMAYSDKLFKPFERLHADPEFHGTGIGLALAGMIVHRHGGRIGAEGAPGKGATFRFSLGPT
jgi:light-regulated signal transduction histidine kinase (bacteriophytochrome)